MHLFLDRIRPLEFLVEETVAGTVVETAAVAVEALANPKHWRCLVVVEVTVLENPDLA